MSSDAGGLSTFADETKMRDKGSSSRLPNVAGVQLRREAPSDASLSWAALSGERHPMKAEAEVAAEVDHATAGIRGPSASLG